MAVDHLELAQLEGLRGGDGRRSDGQSAGEVRTRAHSRRAEMVRVEELEFV
jgi:hypothetical protein